MTQEQQWFCDLVEQNKTALFRLAVSILRSEEDAKDAVAEAVYRAWAKRDGLSDRAKARAWLLRIAANEAYNICRRRQRELPMDESLQEMAAPPMTEDEDVGLWPLVRRLPETLRTPLTLFYYDDLSVREIAAVLDVQEGAVKTRLSRGRQRLKELLQEEGIDDASF